MLSFVHTWFTPGANPVGIDFGTDCLRLAQVERDGKEFRLIAAASTAVPIDVQNDPAARFAFFTRTVRELWSRGNFRGRQAILALPAASMCIQHLRLPRMDDESLKKAIPWEAQGKLPIDASKALIRHLVAGDVYAGDQPRSEVILMAAPGEFVEQFLAAAAKARLEVIGMTVEPKAILDCFLNVYRRRTDTGVTNCFVDIGRFGSRAVIAHGGQILFARSIAVGGEQFNHAVAAGLNVSLDEAKRLRFENAAPGGEEARGQGNDPQAEGIMVLASADGRNAVHQATPVLVAGGIGGREEIETSCRAGTARREPQLAGSARPTCDLHDRSETHGESIDAALHAPLSRLIEELTLCRRYHESTFPNRPVQRLVFVGGEARQRTLCQSIAKGIGVAALIGDPLVRMGRTAEIGIESGIDRRLPQPAWAVAIGLSMGSPVCESRIGGHR